MCRTLKTITHQGVPLNDIYLNNGVIIQTEQQNLDKTRNERNRKIISEQNVYYITPKWVTGQYRHEADMLHAKTDCILEFKSHSTHAVFVFYIPKLKKLFYQFCFSFVTHLF